MPHIHDSSKSNKYWPKYDKNIHTVLDTFHQYNVSFSLPMMQDQNKLDRLYSPAASNEKN
jgi:hypothetical protein